LLQHVFELESRDDLIKLVQDAAANNVGVSVKQRKEPITFEQFQLHRFGKYRSVVGREYLNFKWDLLENSADADN